MSPVRSRRKRRSPWIIGLSAALLIMPMLEVAAILFVGRQVGAWWTIGLLIFWSSLGAWIVSREGARTWRALKGSLSTGHELSRQLTDAALVLVGGTLLLAPGFITDAMGLFLVVPLTRPITRRALQRVVEKKLLGGVIGGGLVGETSGFDDPTGFGSFADVGDPWGTPGGTRGRGPAGSAPGGAGPVISGEVVDDEDRGGDHTV
ncbi:UPF0716 protein FxsA [Kytococcus aerolatus]|uniref:UPF0716 protein FxsA n=1 Tax=Kytococcus aerolatus TaxID=592308 RepID=A0A212T1W8_9MICO|nr:FxsA family protein [Kytococcus aerolatus]SNC60009.1 UPF0716 protein FxsA [Kytococcus aerolatus]